jgi:hypothetical protein
MIRALQLGRDESVEHGALLETHPHVLASLIDVLSNTLQVIAHAGARLAPRIIRFAQTPIGILSRLALCM